MNGIIECAFVGRLAQEPQMRESKAGKRWASLSIAIGAGDEVTWVRVAVFGEAADLIGGLAKGTQVYVEGRIKLESWTDKDGELRSGLGVAASLVQPLGQIGRKRASAARRTSPDLAARHDWQRPAPATGASGTTDKHLRDDPIPF